MWIGTIAKIIPDVTLHDEVYDHKDRKIEL